jgi:hypothetical protein
VTGILNARSGTPFSIVNCGGAATAETPCARVAVTGNVGQGGNSVLLLDPLVPNRFLYIDPTIITASGVPSTGNAFFGQFPSGMIGRNLFRGPGYCNIDAGIHKRFRITEDTGLQFRAEFYNAFNNANAFVRGSEVEIRSTGYVPVFYSSRRHIQLALKLTF